MSPEGQTAGVRREARRQWKITEMPPVNAQSLGLIELGFLRVDSINRNQILSKIRSRSRPDRCIWHANRGKSNQLSNQSNVLSINQSHHGTISKTGHSWFNSQECQSNHVKVQVTSLPLFTQPPHFIHFEFLAFSLLLPFCIRGADAGPVSARSTSPTYSQAVLLPRYGYIISHFT